ncbi:MAG TPA: radical SAM family heme chaperone HemW [Mariprofundaceae bacterium]|nr:radical SAM family heme chaperone HemW [Mariprofundaceae bacterium]
MPLQLYVHIPYCLHKCHYCDFNSHAGNDFPWEGYRVALLAELEHWSDQEQFAGRRIHSVFFGGGTPSLAPPKLITGIIEATSDRFGLTDDAEITLEANPGTVDIGNFRDYRQAGVNRLSIGVQSLDTGQLQWLERIHSPDEALAAFETGRTAGFTNINLDLMYGLPGQSVANWLQTVDTVIGLGPDHLSCYQLTIEPHTRLADIHRRQPLPLPDDETSLQFFSTTRQRLAEAGYQPYEISNFARAGAHCRHNDGYWLYHDYIGIGAGAAGKWDSSNGGAHRYSNIRSPETYMLQARLHGQAVNNHESLGRHMSAAEAVWMGLRRHSGFSRTWFSKRFGLDVLAMFGSELETWRQLGHLIVGKDSIRLSESGIVQADSIAADLF